MAHYYFDSSALVKRYVAEMGTGWVTTQCSPEAGHAINASFDLPAIIFVSADQRLNAAATTEGLPVENPNDYP